MASNSVVYKQISAAEKLATEKIMDARKNRIKRLKQAKDEAQAVIDAYKIQREQQFIDYEKRVMGNKDEMVVNIDKSTAEQIAVLNQRVINNKEKAMQHLLETVFDIRPQLHINLTKDG